MVKTTSKKVALTVAELQADLLAEVPSGWAATSGDGWTDGSRYEQPLVEGFGKDVKHVILTQGACTVALNLYPIKRGDRWDREHGYRGCKVEGHTLADGGSFTRSGIDTHSCALVSIKKNRYDHDYGSLPDLLASEASRVVAVLARQHTAEAVPGLPFTRQPEWFTKAASDLRAGRAVQLTPRGMGVGYTLFVGRSRSRHGRRADPALEAKLGVSPILVEAFDYD